jgi:WD40 repeat protein
MQRWRLVAGCCWFLGSLIWMTPWSNRSMAQEQLQSGGVIRLLPLPGERECPVITALALAPQGNGIAAAGDDHSIRWIDPLNHRSMTTVVAHRDWVKCIAFSPSGLRLASCGNDGAVKVWEVTPQDGLKLLIERSADHALFGVAFASDNELYAVGFGNAVYRMNIGEDQWGVDHRCDCNDLRAIDISRDGRYMAYGGRDGIIRIQSLLRPDHALASASPPGTSQPIKVSPSLHFDRILAIRFSEDGTSVFSCGEDRRVVQWDPADNRVVAQMEIQAGKLMALCPLDNGLIAVSGSDNTIRIVDINRATMVSKLVGHDGSVAILKRNSTHLFSGGFDTTVRTWNIEESIHRVDDSGRFVHPISAQFEDSSAQERIR